MEPTQNEAKLMAKIEFLNKELNELKETLRFQRGDIWDMEEHLSDLQMRNGIILTILILASLAVLITYFIKWQLNIAVAEGTKEKFQNITLANTSRLGIS